MKLEPSHDFIGYFLITVTEHLKRQYKGRRFILDHSVAASPLEWGRHGGGNIQLRLPTFWQTKNTDSSGWKQSQEI